jgi:pSer/pThr/pTyr-binding forkhead associated (FHA) protein
MHTPFKIGRALDNDLVLGDTTVSRYHAVLELEKEVLFVRDLRSTNGTYLNGRRIERSRIKEGDVLRLGQAEISVVHD